MVKEDGLPISDRVAAITVGGAAPLRGKLAAMNVHMASSALAGRVAKSDPLDSLFGGRGTMAVHTSNHPVPVHQREGCGGMIETRQVLPRGFGMAPCAFPYRPGQAGSLDDRLELAPVRVLMASQTGEFLEPKPSGGALSGNRRDCRFVAVDANYRPVGPRERKL